MNFLPFASYLPDSSFYHVNKISAFMLIFAATRGDLLVALDAFDKRMCCCIHQYYAALAEFHL